MRTPNNPRTLLLTLILTTLVLSLGAPSAVQGTAIIAQTEGSSVRRDVTYCTAGGVELKMDIFPPTVPDTAPAPVIVYVHGGGWTSGDKSWIERVINPAYFTARGYLVGAVNYRLAPRFKWPAQIEDVKCAVRYLRANAASLKLDPARIGAWGESAGGHLVSLLGLAGPSAGFEGSGGYAEQSSAVQAVVSLSGPADLSTLYSGPYRSQVARILFNTSPDQEAETLRQASPVTYVSGAAPPFLLLAGDQDPLVPPQQARTLHDSLTAAGASSSLVVIKNSGHVLEPAGGSPDPPNTELREMVLDFFDRTVLGALGDTRLFTETDKTVRERFLAYWNAHGGLAQQGYPVSNELQERSDTDGKTYTVQYFERAVFEHHPENQAPYDVLLSLLGTFRYNEKYPGGVGAPAQEPNTSPGSVLFPETGKRLGGRFLDYWQKNGGLAQQGLPVSDEFMEKSDLNGQTYRVQYFERAVLELHPENAPPNDVLLSQLGTLRYKAKGGR
jgi:acetyl esterase/lipase